MYSETQPPEDVVSSMLRLPWPPLGPHKHDDPSRCRAKECHTWCLSHLRKRGDSMMSWGYHNSWMVCFTKNPKITWMIWGVPGNLQAFFVNVYNTSTTADSPYFFPQYFISRCLAEEISHSNSQLDALKLGINGQNHPIQNHWFYTVLSHIWWFDPHIRPYFSG